MVSSPINSHSVWKYAESVQKYAFWRHVTSYDVRTSDFQKNLRNNIFDLHADKIWDQTDAQGRNDRWFKMGPKNVIMT